MKQLASNAVTWRYISPIFLTTLSLLVFSNAFPDEFVMDAREIVANNPRLRSDAPWYAVFTSNYWGDFRYFGGSYRPLTIASFRIQYGTFGFGYDPVGYVAVNLLLHITVVLLVWRLMLAMLKSHPGALSAAAIFAVHPIVTEIVPNIVGLGDLLATCFVIATLLCWHRFYETNHIRWAGAAAGIWAIGLLSKESAVVLPGLLVTWDLARESSIRKSLTRLLTRPCLIAYGILFVTALLWFILRESILAPHRPRFVEALMNPMVLETTANRIMTALQIVSSYLLQALLPVTLAPDYSFNQISMIRSPFDPGFILWMLLLAGAVAAILLLWRKKPWRMVSLGLLWFFIILSPVSNLLLVIAAIRADRFLYLPMIGISLCLGVVFGWLYRREEAKKSPRPALVVVSACGLLVVYGAYTYQHNTIWQHNLNLWEHTASVSPQSIRALYNQAWFLNRDRPEDQDRIIGILEKAVAITNHLPGDEAYNAHINLGKAYINKAEQAMSGSRLSATSVSWLEKAVAVLREGEQRERHEGRRRAWWEEAVGRKSAAVGDTVVFGDALLHVNLGTVLDNLRQPDEAIMQFEHAVAIAPERTDYRYRLAFLYMREGRLDHAESACEETVRRAPAYEEAWSLLTEVRFRLGKYAEAVDAVVTGSRNLPDSARLHESVRRAYRIAVAQLRQAGRQAEADALIKQGTERDGMDAALWAEQGR